MIELVAAHPDAHLELLHGWLNAPHVDEWWNSAGSRDEVRSYVQRQLELPHVQPWVASTDGVPFAYVETYRAAEDPLAEHYEARAGDRGWHVLVGEPSYLGTGVPRELGRVIVDRLLAEGERVVCEPDERNERMLAFCRALGGEVRATLELPDKRAALVVWER